MQVKIIIGTIAFMLTMMLFGFAVLREPARLQRFSQARVGRAIEKGATLYMNNCSSCHGVNGRAEECFDPASGEPIACKGFVLQSAELLCGDPSQRMTAYGWIGSKHDFIKTTIAAGRPGGIMPTWSEDFGGPMRPDEVEDITQFVLNWESDDVCGQVVAGPEWPTMASDLPAGDPANGQQLYQLTLGCAGCHGQLDQAGTAAVGPWLGNLDVDGATRIEGYTAADYIYESILKPNAYVASECPSGPCASPSGMPPNFGLRMSPQDMADVMSYLLGASTFESSAEVIYPEP